MKAIILAAGYGNRMKPLTDSTHKTLLSLGKETIIERMMESLLKNNINDIIIVTGYRAEELKNFLLKKFSYVNFQFVHNRRFKETNNIYSLALVFQSIVVDDYILLIESDLVYEPAVIQRIINSKYKNVALVDKFKGGMDGTVVTLDSNIITNIIPSYLQDRNFDFSDKFKTLNIYKFSKDFCNSVFKKLLTYYAKVFDDNC